MATVWRSTRWYPRLALSVALGAGLLASTAVPGYAQPTEVPDPGARPAPAGQVPLPDGSFARPPTGSETLVGPLAAEIAELQIEIGTRTTELQTIEPAIGSAEQALTSAEQAWQAASQAHVDAQLTLDDLVGDSYRGAAALPPDLFIPELRGLSAHAPVVPVEAPLGAATAARELVAARAAEREASSWFETATVAEQDLAQRRKVLETELARLRTELDQLQDRNAALLAAAERERERAAQDQVFPLTQPVAGFRAGAAALRAVDYALDQLGKPYLWGAEGPDRFDCSGLVFAAYNHARAGFGVTAVPRLPRVAADQYRATETRLVARTATVARNGLLPGDLVFFASGPSWQTVHHVGMYVGNGYMVHAPNRNEVVKVSPVWWSRFFAATRVVEAVRVSTPDPDPDPSRTPTPRPGPAPTGSPIGPTTPPPPSDPPTTSPPTSPPPPTPQTVVVPDVTGLNPENAAIAIEAVGLEWDVGTPVTDGSCNTADVVAQQVPEAGTVVPVEGTTVTYHLCQPPTPPPTPEETPSEAPTDPGTPTPTESGTATSPSPPPG